MAGGSTVHRVIAGSNPVAGATAPVAYMATRWPEEPENEVRFLAGALMQQATRSQGLIV